MVEGVPGPGECGAPRVAVVKGRDEYVVVPFGDGQLRCSGADEETRMSIGVTGSGTPRRVSSRWIWRAPSRVW